MAFPERFLNLPDGAFPRLRALLANGHSADLPCAYDNALEEG